MWQREDIGQQTFLNTQDTVYEVLSKTPEHILCKNQDAVKIDLLLKQSQNAEPHPVYGVKLVPYKNVASGVVIDPNAGGNFSQNVALAIAFIAADRDDWQRFIPVGMKTRELAKTKKRQEEIILKQNQPFKNRSKKDQEEKEEEEEFETVEREDDYENSSVSGSEGEVAEKEEEEEAECNEPLMVYDHVAKEWVPATDEEQKDFGFDQNNAVQREGEPFTKAKSLAQKSALPNPQEDAAASKELHDRVAKVLREQEQRANEEANLLPSDRIRRQVATLNDPISEANASEITQRYRGADMGINIEEERQKAKERACGIKSETNNSSVSLLDRFAPEPEISMEPIAQEKGKAPQYSLQQLMQFGSKTKPSPSIQRILDQKNNTQILQGVATVQTTVQEIVGGTVGGTPVGGGGVAVAPIANKNSSDIVAKIAAKYRAIRRKELELALLMLELDELLQ